jgi:hypothetical protein
VLRDSRAEYGGEIVAALRRQLTWTHFKRIISSKTRSREISTQRCAEVSVEYEVLEQKTDGILYERTALSKKREKLIQKELAALRERSKVPSRRGSASQTVAPLSRSRHSMAFRVKSSGQVFS